MNFYLKKNKILSVHVKDKSCNSLKISNFIKKGLQHVFSCEYPNILGAGFL